MLSKNNFLSSNVNLKLGMGDGFDIDLVASNIHFNLHLGDYIIDKLRRLLHEYSVGGDRGTVGRHHGPAVVHVIGVGNIVEGSDTLGVGGAHSNEVVGSHLHPQGGQMSVS